MSKIKLLDCTLRDGGYINHWRFGRQVIAAVAEKLSSAKVDIIEAGFLTDMPHTADDSLYSDCRQLDAVLNGCGESKSSFAAMIAVGEMELDPEGLPPARETLLDIVRITFHNSGDEVGKAFQFAQCLMAKGYKVCMQPVGTTSYTDLELLELIEKVNRLEPYAFYLVDTLGILQDRELLHFVDVIDHNLAPGIRMGFHSHNNLQMSYANAQRLIDYRTDREIILDCSVYGMGRGAGNLCTELIAQYVNATGVGRYEMMPIYEALDNYIYPIFVRTGWGYNAHYYISAVHGCHPNYAAFLMNKQTLTMNEVDLILRNLPAGERGIYHKELIEERYYRFQDHNIDDTAARERLRDMIAGRCVLLLAPGKSIAARREQIERFIQIKKPVTISINTVFRELPSDLIFVSNLKRLYSLDTESVDIPVILTSNLPNAVRSGIYVDYAALCDKNRDEPDNSGAMLLRLMLLLGEKRVYLAGFDGFSKEYGNNYCDDRLINSVDPGDVNRKNESIDRQLRQLGTLMDIISITPSRYSIKQYEEV